LSGVVDYRRMLYISNDRKNVLCPFQSIVISGQQPPKRCNEGL